MMLYGVNYGSNNTKNSWKAYIMDIEIVPPVVKTNYIEVPGLDGYLDLSEVIAGRILYGNQTLKVRYKVLRKLSSKSMYSLWDEITTAIHGKRHDITFDESSNYKFTGRSICVLGSINEKELIFTVESSCDPQIVKSGETAKTLTSISASYNGGAVPPGTSVNNLSVSVVAHYSNGTTQKVTSGYSLSGTIREGSNTITVTYQGKTTTINVTGVSSAPVPATLLSISVTWNATSAAAGTNPANLISSVRGSYSDGSTKSISSYTVSPAKLSVGSNTVTVSYGGKSTTKTITGTQVSVALFILGTSKLNSTDVLG